MPDTIAAREPGVAFCEEKVIVFWWLIGEMTGQYVESIMYAVLAIVLWLASTLFLEYICNIRNNVLSIFDCMWGHFTLRPVTIFWHCDAFLRVAHVAALRKVLRRGMKYHLFKILRSNV